MDMKNIRILGAGTVAAIWLFLTASAWFGPAEATSESERRELAQMPQITLQSLLSGDFMEDFEDYTLDQFPLRETFRRIKSLFHYNGLKQLDNNDIYIEDGFAVKQEYPLNENSVVRAASRFAYLYQKYLAETDAKVYLAVVPDKGQYLAGESGHLTLDVAKMAALLAEGMPWATEVDLSGYLTAEDYYRTDTHWRQEKLLGAAGALCEAMGNAVPRAEDFRVTGLERPFYGVYYGQAALPMDPDTMYLMESDILDGCVTSVAQWDNKAGQAVYQKLYDGVYDREKLEGKDMYEGFLSGTQGILRIDNPNATTDRKLILIRDSFGSSIAPLLVQSYASVTLVDIRAVQIDMLGNFLEFNGQDVLFLFSSLVLNNSSTIK